MMLKINFQPQIVICSLLFVCLSSLTCSAQYEISGKLTGYDRFFLEDIYLSLISPGEKYNHVSLDQIINQAKISSNGSFSFKGNFLTEKPSILRLYTVSKKTKIEFSDYPKNHITFIADQNSIIEINSSNFGDIDQEVTFSGEYMHDNNQLSEMNMQLADL